LSTVGLGLHAFALNAGPLAVVQPLLVLGVLFALPLHRRLRRQRIPRRELWWALALVVGLAGFLAVATAGVPTAHETAHRGPAIAAGVLAVGAAAGCVLLARGRQHATAAALLGVATGIVLAGTATLIKACTNLLAQGPLALITSWQPYALLAAGGVALLFNQLSFQAGPLSASLPAITVVEPLLAILLGILVYHENLRHTPWSIATECGFLALFTTAAFALTRHEAMVPSSSCLPSG
jgi:drug/metabolite transporter (DMT)-like permease